MGAAMAIETIRQAQWRADLQTLVRPITIRLNGEVLDYLAAQLETTLTLPVTLRTRNPGEVADVLQTILYRLLAQGHSECSQLRDDVAELRELYYRTPEGEDRVQILKRTIERQPTDWTVRLMDNKATHRHLDWEAMEERLAFDQWRLWMRQVVMLEILEGLYGGFAKPETALSFHGGAERFESASERLVDLLNNSSYPLVRRQAARTLRALWRLDGGLAGEQFVRYREDIFRRIDDVGEDRWTRTTLVDLLGHCPHDAATEKLLTLILDTDESGDRFLLRSHAVSTYAAWCEDVSQLRAGFIHLASAQQTGQYVRLALVEATKIVRAANVTEFILDLAEAENGRPDSSEGVRARYAESVSHRLQVEKLDPHTRQLAARFVTWWATRDPSPVVRRIAQEELEALLPHLQQQGFTEAGAWIVQALGRRLNLEPAPGETERIAGILEATRIAGTPALRELRDELRAVVVEIDWGQTRRLALPEGTDPMDVMRIFASITRRDVGLYARFEPGHVRVQRGERFGKSLWRILHELRNPKPRKRPDTTHTRARRFRFEYRAHPEILAEVNPTDIPGERQIVESEAGWARYMPGVDDLLDARRKPVYLVSSFGVTTVQPPQRGRMALFARLVWNYSRINHARYQALRQSEPLRQALYIRMLREDYGFSCEFVPHRVELFGVHLTLQSARVLSYFSGEVTV